MERNLFHTKLKESAIEIRKIIFETLSHDEILVAIANMYDTNSLVMKIEATTDKLTEIQNRHITRKVVKEPKNISTHPWTRNRRCIAFYRTKMTAKRTYSLYSTSTNNERLKVANTKKSTLPVVMKSNGVSFSGNKRIEMLSKHLQSCFTISDIVFTANVDDLAFQIDDIYRLNYSSDYEHLWSTYTNWFQFDEVFDALTKLDEKTDTGPMGISAKFLKYHAESIAPILLNILDSVMQTGIIPPTWKQSFIVPIPKKGVLVDVSNYRGISIQSVIPKILDKLITDKLFKHVREIIPKSQQGFLKNRSTATNLLEFSQFIHENLKHNDRIDSTEAYDHVDHELMAKKLAAISMPYLFFKVIIGFVTNRKYTIKVDGTVYDNSFITSSAVPQK